ncbi:MAG: hypothetical protein ACI9F2_000014 [Lysobacterales bacterium]|jgi:hypothetical protein
MKEVDMYLPLKLHLEDQGYLVHSEVEDIDIMAMKGKEIVIVEMKMTFSFLLVHQLVERLKITDLVYACIPLGKKGRWPKSYKKMCSILKRLNCGLITLDQATMSNVVVEFEPGPFTGNLSPKKKKLAIKEFEGRSIDLNQGGCRGEILFTSYKEQVIRIAMYLFENGAAPIKEIRENLDIEKTREILNSNYFKWFDRVARGVYQVTPEFEFFRIKYKKEVDQLWR